MFVWKHIYFVKTTDYRPRSTRFAANINVRNEAGAEEEEEESGVEIDLWAPDLCVNYGQTGEGGMVNDRIDNILFIWGLSRDTQ